ncbi:hypothetical protein [Variovorax sp. PBL-E5]|uniref:hypothetical protein n=1 Tax=Variovorax sp. PBL-E5 TaxID=434014 RepID=UPI0013A54DAB|nr:hypothetical protein [Variovorax sp. PBL-E5]
MSAVATKPQGNGEKLAPQSLPFAELLECMRLDLRAADGLIEAAYDASEEGSSVEILLDMINHSMFPEVLHPLIKEGAPTRAEAERIQLELFQPLAALDGAICLARGSILEHHLREAYGLIDGVQDELDSCSDFMRLLPETTHEQPRKADFDIDDTPEARRDLACDANYEISKLAEAVKRLMDGEEDRPIFNGIMGRIELLSELVHHVMCLAGGSDEEMGRPPLRSLRAWYEGRPS